MYPNPVCHSQLTPFRFFPTNSKSGEGHVHEAFSGWFTI
jgi:hypothetical protein